MSFADVVGGLTLDPAMWWRCNESAGTTLADASGNGRTGTLNGGFTLQQPSITGDGDKGILLNGTTGYMQATAYSPFAVGSKRTFVLLLNRALGQSGIRNIFGGSGSFVAGVSGDLKYPVLESSGTSPDRFRYYGSIKDQFPVYADWSEPEPVSNSWLMIALRVDDSTAPAQSADLTVNRMRHGIPDIEAAPLDLPYHWNAEAGQLMVGARHDNLGGFQTNEFHHATYDEIMVFEGLLTDADISSLAGGGLAT